MIGPVYTIAPDADFLKTLADRVLDGTLTGDWPREGPFWLSDVVIYLPTARARVALADRFLERGHRLLPDIRTFGSETGEDEPFLPPFEAPPALRPVSRDQRMLVLSRLVAAFAASPEGGRIFASPPGAAEIFAMSRALGELVDDLETEERSARDLAGIVPEALAETWQQSLKFLAIALSTWPGWLAERGMAEPIALRRERLDRQATHAAARFGERPVIAAGSTGSIPSTARLLRAIARLPRGAVVLPGLDKTLSDAEFAALLKQETQPHGHPQYLLARLVVALGETLSGVEELHRAAAPRTRLVRRALASVEATADWAAARLSPGEAEAACAGLSLIVAPGEDEEARAVALAAREALGEGLNVGMVTPDQQLARRIAAELKRFGVVVDDPAGEPLILSPAGRIARELIALAQGGCDRVDLVALLGNRLVGFGLPRDAVEPLAETLDLARGERIGAGIAGLRAALELCLAGTDRGRKKLSADTGAAIAALLDRVEQAIAPLLALCEETTIRAGDFARALRVAYDLTLAADRDAPGTAEFRAWADTLVALEGEGQGFAPRGLESVLAVLMGGHDVRAHAPRRSDVVIWGRLEARLQAPDVMILAGLNEDVWPEPADPGPWLSRGMRLAAGLEPPERRHGQAAHDFEMALGVPRAVLACARRIGSKPALPSRYLERVLAFLGEPHAGVLRERGARYVAAAAALDATGRPVPARNPVPDPPASLRPRRLSITEVETLVRSPYDLYAKHVLALRPIDPLGHDPAGRERGTIIHEIFARFVREGHDVGAESAMAVLERLAMEEFEGLEAIADRRDIWLTRFLRAAVQFLAFERARNHAVAARNAEIGGQLTLPRVPPFRLVGTADRVDWMSDGTLVLLDFKTGAIPAKREMSGFDAPQLLLEALIARSEGFDTVPPAPVSELAYVKIGFGADPFEQKLFALPDGWTMDEAIDEIAARLGRHVDAMLYSQTPMSAAVMPRVKQRFAGAYDHLARLPEWSRADGEES